MITKIKHHPILANMCLFFILMFSTYSLGFIINLWWFLLFLPVFALYIFGFVWNDKHELLCPKCSRTYWDKTKYYCSSCGVLMVFKKKEKVKIGEEPKLGQIAIPTCSRGHEIYSLDSYCPRCGESLKE